MDWFLSLFNIILVLVFYEVFHGILYYKSREVKREGRISVRVLDINEENAVTLNSIFFRNTIVFLSNKIDEKILTHEEGHTKQFNYIYAFLIAVAALLSISTLLAIPAILVGKFLLWKMERDADLYAYTKYNIKYESVAERPKSKIDRIKAWVFDTHPPDWVREKEEYYEKKISLIKLFIQDLTS
ncbi:conjugal transfer protein [Sulfolobus acidocaldarius]|uniref:conjugal transfer protein n=1 Tax=Sulfolobus acidocaldarius TaxID=2285 RepID=UPI000B14A95A|nr:conjugal transfer protein [Sulfolobus acidocaldarius]